MCITTPIQGRDHLGHVDADGRIILKFILSSVWGCGLDSSGSRWELRAPVTPVIHLLGQLQSYYLNNFISSRTRNLAKMHQGCSGFGPEQSKVKAEQVGVAIMSNTFIQNVPGTNLGRKTGYHGDVVLLFLSPSRQMRENTSIRPRNT
jgi:hypothetical protein